MAADTQVIHEEPTAGAGSHASTATLFARSVRAEWVKLRSIRSFYGCVLATIGLSAALAAFLAWAIGAGEAADVMVGSTAELAANGTTLGQIALLVLAALMITGEYATGSIRSTLSAAPVRPILLLAKATVLIAVAAVTSVASLLAGMMVSAPLVSDHVAETTPAQLAEYIGYTITGVGLFALLVLSLGVLLRSTAATITVTVATMFAPAIIAGMAANETVSEIITYLPADLQEAFLSGGTAAHQPLTAGLLMTAWAGAAFIAAALVLARRDA